MTAHVPGARPPLGRPGATSHEEIEQAAFRLFTQHGFERTTLDMIATEVGVGRRTLFRYFQSKNDIPWGHFAKTLDGFRDILNSMPKHLPLHEAVHRGVLAFNDFPTDAAPPHRQRMRLILETPTLQAHAALRYRDWRGVIAEFVAQRTGLDTDALLPQTVGHVSLALALTAYEAWLTTEDASVQNLLAEAMTGLSAYLAE